jgi:hypothetical protein
MNTIKRLSMSRGIGTTVDQPHVLLKLHEAILSGSSSPRTELMNYGNSKNTNQVRAIIEEGVNDLLRLLRSIVGHWQQPRENRSFVVSVVRNV